MAAPLTPTTQSMVPVLLQFLHVALGRVGMILAKPSRVSVPAGLTKSRLNVIPPVPTFGSVVHHLFRLYLFAVLLTVAHTSVSHSSQLPRREANHRGIVVESVVKGTQGERIGIRTGDVLLWWQRGPIQGELGSPFDVPHVAIEQATRGVVRIHGQRGRYSHTWLLNSSPWGFQTRPNLSGTYLGIYEHAMRLSLNGQHTLAAEHLRRAAQLAQHEHQVWL